MNGKSTNYLEVEKGAKVSIQVQIEATKGGNYCPGCIVQLYWGIHGYTSKCAKSFHGYTFPKMLSKHSFKAPAKDGIYYITMGGSLDYSCKNNKNRPMCRPSTAFAVIKVGNPDPEIELSLEPISKGDSTFLSTDVIKHGCIGVLNQTEWSLDGQVIKAHKNKREILLEKEGTYQVKWFNCQNSKDSISYFYKASDKNEVDSVEVTKEDSTDFDALLKDKEKVVLKNLTFDLGQAVILPDGKKELDKLAQIMSQNPNMKILLEGHTDVIGDPRKNMVLSKERVKAAKKYLISKNIKANRISTIGWGHKKPLIRTKDKEKGRINRRVEVTIIE